MRKLLIKLCNFLEKILYKEPTWEELSEELDMAKYKLHEARSEIEYLKSLFN